MDNNIIKQRLGIKTSDLKEELMCYSLAEQMKISILLDVILKELRDEADKGEYYLVQGTATTTITDNVIDIPAVLGMPEFKVKAYIIINDGKANNLRVGHNVTTGMITSATDIVGQTRNKFFNVLPGENIKITYNRKVIENIYVIANTGTSAFRLWLLW